MIIETSENQNATNIVQYDVTLTQRCYMDSKRTQIANKLWEDYRLEHNMPSMVVEKNRCNVLIVFNICVST